MVRVSSFVLARKDKCSACRACELSCAASHEKSAPKTVGCFESSVLPRLFLTHAASEKMPIQCHHCENAPCIASCLEGALFRDESGAVLLNQERCIGCKNCALACPFGAIQIVDAALQQEKKEKLGSALKCDLCHGRESGPACIAACPNGALSLVDIESGVEEKRKLAVSGILS